MHYWKRLIVVLFLVASASSLKADLIDSVTNGTEVSSGSFYWGTSVNTGADGPWNNLAFHFYDSQGNAQAEGNLYLLNQEYLGTPGSLSAATPGYIATGTDAGSVYVFDPSVILSAAATYWFYTDAAFVLQGNGIGGSYYYTSSPSSSFEHFSGRSINYMLAGDIASEVPEPAGLVLAGVGMLFIALRQRRRSASKKSIG